MRNGYLNSADCINAVDSIDVSKLTFEDVRVITEPDAVILCREFTKRSISTATAKKQTSEIRKKQ